MNGQPQVNPKAITATPEAVMIPADKEDEDEVAGVGAGAVMTRFVPPEETATKRPPPWVTENHEFASAAVRLVQVIPSELVMTRFVPSVETATKRLPP